MMMIDTTGEGIDIATIWVCLKRTSSKVVR